MRRSLRQYCQDAGHQSERERIGLVLVDWSPCGRESVLIVLKQDEINVVIYYLRIKTQGLLADSYTLPVIIQLISAIGKSL